MAQTSADGARAGAPAGTDWDDVLLHVVTGKGGTGKTTVAAALALALASRGKTVLLCEVEGRQGIARLFDVDRGEMSVDTYSPLLDDFGDPMLRLQVRRRMTDYRRRRPESGCSSGCSFVT